MTTVQGESTGHFETESRPVESGDGRWSATISGRWSIGDNSNGGYLLSPALRAMQHAVGHPDPLSVTTHFLRPGRGDRPADIDVDVVRVGRTVGTARSTLGQEGADRLTMVAAFGDVSASAGSSPDINRPAPEVPPPDECPPREGAAQGVDLAISSRLDVRLHPDHVAGGTEPEARLDGWIRFVDDVEPTTLALPLFTDAFPPSVFPLLGRIGWTPTVELTVHVRRRPAPGWIQARFECDDLSGGRMIESGTLWDSTGAVVARSRQIGLVLSAP